jgi:hypothetical protein
MSNTTGGLNSFVGFQAGRFHTSGLANSFVGYQSGYNTTTGNSNAFLGNQAGINNTTGGNNTSLGAYAGPSLPNLVSATAVGFRASVSASNSLVLGSIGGTNGATASTKVGIGTTAPGYTLHVNAGDAAKVGGGVWQVASDQGLKKDIEAFKEGLDVVLSIKPVWFRYNGKAGITTDKRFVGVIAQEMQKIAPYTVGNFVHQDSAGKQETYLDYDANAVTYLLVNAVKEQQGQFEALKAENESLKQELAQIKQALNRLSPEGNTSVARLDQNRPNPFTQTTAIGYFIPDNTTSAQLKIFSVKGQEIYSQELLQKGEGQVVLSTEILKAGTYIYQLVVDGKRVGNKKLVLTR